MKKYCNDLFHYNRRKTREVMVGDVGVGGDNPIRIQSMTISDTLDTEATVNEAVQLAGAGCEIVRITAPSLREAENLKNIKRGLLAKEVNVPLVADIHFTPNAALVAAEYVEKVRINPGNYADRKRFESHEYTDDEYASELARIEEKFSPLVLKCKELGRAMRIGTNHGSLSDRIMNRYGDTATGMVESALEFVRICEKYGYRDIILSMKSSNPLVAIQAYRLLAATMIELEMDYPFHLGVTEAGDGEEGRVKSAIGIGALLEDGIGDTIRVSLTEDPVEEIPVALLLSRKYNDLKQSGRTPATGKRLPFDRHVVRLPSPFEYSRRDSLACDMTYHQVGGGHAPAVELSLRLESDSLEDHLSEVAEMIGANGDGALTLLGASTETPLFKCETIHVAAPSAGALSRILRLKQAMMAQQLFVPIAVEIFPETSYAVEALVAADRIVAAIDTVSEAKFVERLILDAKQRGKVMQLKLGTGDIERLLPIILERCASADYWNLLLSVNPVDDGSDIIAPYRYLTGRLDALEANLPILLHYRSGADFQTISLDASAQIGSLLCDGVGDAIHLESDLPPADLLKLSYNILQATRLRISKTDYISCPSCGRTLFNLQTTTERIKSKTAHLKGVKIAIMGCIVNGPGEMADADFGYVGAGLRKVDLFVGKERVERNISEEMADEKLIELIKSRGKWVPPPA